MSPSESFRSLSGTHQEPPRSPSGAHEESLRSLSAAPREHPRALREPLQSTSGASRNPSEPLRSISWGPSEPLRSCTGVSQQHLWSTSGAPQKPRKYPSECDEAPSSDRVQMCFTTADLPTNWPADPRTHPQADPQRHSGPPKCTPGASQECLKSLSEHSGASQEHIRSTMGASQEPLRNPTGAPQDPLSHPQDPPRSLPGATQETQQPDRFLAGPFGHPSMQVTAEGFDHGSPGSKNTEQIEVNICS